MFYLPQTSGCGLPEEVPTGELGGSLEGSAGVPKCQFGVLFHLEPAAHYLITMRVVVLQRRQRYKLGVNWTSTDDGLTVVAGKGL